MKGRGTRSGRRLGWLGILLPLALGFVLSLGLAYQTWDSSREHRATAEATVRDHAAFAAHLLAVRIDRRVSQAMLYAFYRVDLAVRVEGERWPGVERLRIEQELERCRPVAPDTGRVFFRWLEGEGLDILGPAAPGLRPWLEEWVPETARAHPEERPYGLRFGAPGIGPEGIAFRVYRFPEGTAVYGLDNCLRDLGGDLIEEAVAESAVLPPSLVGDTSNDSLFALAVLDGAGRALRGDRDGAAAYRGSAELEPVEAYGGLSVEVRLTDDTARRLVIGGLPRSRLPEALALVVLTGLLLAVAARQLRRGQELVRLRERFVANVSHELRTPLQQILLFSDLLRLERISAADERRQALGVIHRETRRLMELVENVLAFGAGRDRFAGSLRSAQVPLYDLAVGTVEAFRPLAEERGVRIDVEGDEVTVAADPDGVRRALVNLLDNAVKYGSDGQPIRVLVGRVGAAGVLAVEDRGPGVPAEARDRVWEPHVRLEREESRGRAGHGVGLSIVRDLVHRMGGRVSIDDAPGGGARFAIHLPVRDA